MDLMTVLLFVAFSTYSSYCYLVLFQDKKEHLAQYITLAYYATWLSAIACLYFAIQTNTSLSILLLVASLVGLTTLIVGFILRSPDLKAIGLPLFWQLGLLVLLRVFGWESFQIPSLSMYPNLDIGDYVVVNKHAYQVKFPELGWEIYRVDAPKRGDVVVFYSPETPTLPLIKRVIGIGGDAIRISNNNLYVNGQKYDKIDISKLAVGDLFHETNLAGASYPILMARNINTQQRTAQWLVPKNHIFVLGDNRSNSRDSRYYGFVPLDSLLGRAEFIWMHWPHILSIPTMDRNMSLNPAKSE